jgi:hypothetical protein
MGTSAVRPGPMPTTTAVAAGRSAAMPAWRALLEQPRAVVDQDNNETLELGLNFAGFFSFHPAKRVAYGTGPTPSWGRLERTAQRSRFLVRDR